MIEKIKSHINKEIYDTSLEAKLLLLWLLVPYFMTVSRFILHRFGLDNTTTASVTLFIVSLIPIIVLILNIRKFDKKYYLPGICLFAVVVLLFVVTVAIHPDYMKFFTKPGYGISRILRPDSAIYAFLFVVLLKKSEEVMSVIKKYAVLDFAYMVIFGIMPRMVKGYFEDINYIGEMVRRPYSLTFGYAMLLPTVVFIYMFTKKHNILYIIGAAIGAVSIFTYGNRGAWILIWAYIAALLVTKAIHSENRSAIKIAIALVIAVVQLGVCAVGIPKVIGVVMVSIAEKNDDGNVEQEVPRTAVFASEGKFSDGTGRDEIWGSVEGAIKEGGLFGYGLYGDRQFVEPHHYAGYSHNIVLEMVSNFGIIGVLIILKLIIDGIRMVFLCKDEYYRDVYIIMFTVAFQLFMSMSFWYVTEFWILLAVTYCYIYRDGKITTLGKIIKNKLTAK